MKYFIAAAELHHMNTQPNLPSSRFGCGAQTHLHRRNALHLLGLSGLSWLTTLGQTAAFASPTATTLARPAKSLILLWMDGGPSQLETFDPHAGRAIAAGTGDIESRLKSVRLAAGMARTAEVLDQFAIVRNVISREGDHERANYNAKTGYRPDPTLVHPAVGAILAHQLPIAGAEIPRHISILPGAWPARGGYLGEQFDAFKTGDPNQPIPDVIKRVPPARFRRRLEGISIVDQEFQRGRAVAGDPQALQQQETLQQAMRMMDSDQLSAFDVSGVPRSERLEFGDSPFGRGCLAAARLAAVGVRCIEVTLGGWDLAHATNHRVHDDLVPVLDAGLSGLVRYLKRRDQLKDTLVVCCGEFGRTPSINPAGGRDHWPHGYSIAMAGGPLATGQVIGETDPEGTKLKPEQGTPIADVHATLLRAMGVDPTLELDTPVNRPMKLSEGTPIARLLR